MKRILFSCVFLLALLCTITLHAQKISLNLKKATLTKVLNEVTKQTGYVFIYDQNEIGKSKIDIQLKDATLQEVFAYCEKFYHITYKIIGKNVVIKRKIEEGEFKLNGTISTENNTELQDVSIYMPRLQKFVFSDADGNFSISDVKIGDSITLALVGYNELSEVVDNSKMLFFLTKKSNDLEDVQVLAYGQTTNRRLNTGSSVKVTAKELERTATLDPVQALQGRVPGLVITPNSGLAGANSNITLRGVNSTSQASGVNSYNSTNTPLFIVDGIPFNNNSLTQLGNSSQYGYQESPFKSIDPNNIESIEVLKDADATAIYGARGANGVILITTKKGRKDGLNFNLNIGTTMQHIPKYVKMLNTTQYLELRRQAYANDLADGNVFEPMDATNSPDVLAWDTTINHNWAKEYFNKWAHLNTVDFSVNGGNAYNSFSASASYNNQTTIYNSHSGIDRGSFMLTGNHSSKDGKFSINAMLSYSVDRNRVIPMSLDNFINLPPDFSLYNSDGSINWALGGSSGNPIAAQMNTMRNHTKSFNSSFNLSYEILQGLSFKLNAGYNWMYLNEFGQNPIASQDPSNGTMLGSSQKSFSKNYTLNVEPQLNYEKYLGKNHFSVLLGGTYMKTSTLVNGESAIGFTSDKDLNDYSKAQAINYTYQEGTYKFLSGFARVGYDYDSKYVINLTGRRDGSSRFGPGKQYGDFGSIGAAWNFSDEKFFEWMKPAISFAKLRGSYGITGSDQIGDYQYYVNYDFVYSPYQDQLGYYPQNLYNSDYQWESTKKLDIGLELGFWDNRLYFTGDYYRNVTGNQLTGYQLPTFTGEDHVMANLNAKTQNTGFEFTLRFDEIKSKDFNWTTNFNFAIERNKLLSFPGLATSGYQTYYFLGKPISNITGYTNAKINPADGSVSVEDINKDGTITVEGDQGYIGSKLPKYTGGIENTFTYKNLSLDVFFTFKNQAYTQVYTFQPGSTYNQPEIVWGNIWQERGDVKKFPKASTTYTNDMYLFNNSLAAYYSGSYLRLQSATLNYSLPKNWIKRFGFTKFDVYAMSNNLFTFTSNPGFDPETGMSMPNLRSFTFGIRTSFK